MSNGVRLLLAMGACERRGKKIEGEKKCTKFSDMI